MTDPLLTPAHISLLNRLEGFFKGIPGTVEDTSKIIGTVVADVATIKEQIGSGDYVAIVAGLQSDIAALKTEVASLTAQVKTSLNPSPAPASTSAAH